VRHRTTGTFLLFLATLPSFAAAGVENLVTYKAEFPLAHTALPLLLSDAMEDAVYVGDIEIRQQIQYDAPARQLIVWTFAASPTWSRPASLVDVQNNQIDQFRVDVTEIRFSESSWRTIEFNGTVATPLTTALMVAGGNGTSLMGAVPGLPVRLVSSYLPGSVAQFLGNTTLMVTGGAWITAPEAVGRVTIETTPNRAPVASVIGPEPETSNFEIGFDASASKDPDGDELDYKWHVLGGTVALRGCETPTPVFQFNSGPGTYDFRLTLTDARGATAITTHRVEYRGR
jgi:hypothetical protein